MKIGPNETLKLTNAFLSFSFSFPITLLPPPSFTQIPHVKIGPEETPKLPYLRFASVTLYPSNEDLSLAIGSILRSFGYPTTSLVCAKAECESVCEVCVCVCDVLHFLLHISLFPQFEGYSAASSTPRLKTFNFRAALTSCFWLVISVLLSIFSQEVFFLSGNFMSPTESPCSSLMFIYSPLNVQSPGVALLDFDTSRSAEWLNVLYQGRSGFVHIKQ